MNVKRKRVTFKSPKPIQPTSEWVEWEIYDTQTIDRKELISKYREFTFFAEPIGPKKSLSETNMQQYCVLPAPLKFNPREMHIEVLEPVNKYIADYVKSNWTVEFWIGQKVCFQTTQTRFIFSARIADRQMFAVRVRFNEDFMLLENVRIKVRLLGELERSVQ